MTICGNVMRGTSRGQRFVNSKYKNNFHYDLVQGQTTVQFLTILIYTQQFRPEISFI